MTGPITTQQQPNPQDPAQPQNGQAQDQPVTTAEVLDADEIEYRQALALAEAEEAKTNQPAGQDQPNGGAQAQQPNGQAPKGDQQPGQARPATPVIPKARFDEVSAARDEAARQAAYWRGVAEGRQPAKPAPGEQGQPPVAAPTTAQRLAEVHTSIKALAKQFDNGEITMEGFEDQRNVLLDQAQALREEAFLAKLKPAEPAQDGSLLLDERTVELEERHPWVKVFDQVATKPEWAMLKSLAIENLTAGGIDPTQGDRGSLALRAEIAALMDQLGPGLLTARATAKGVALPGQAPAQPQPQPQQPPGGKPPLSKDAADRAAKLALAANAPPNLTSMTGHVGEAGGGPTDAAIEAMGEADYDKLPEATRRKLLGITAE